MLKLVVLMLSQLLLKRKEQMTMPNDQKERRDGHQGGQSVQ